MIDRTAVSAEAAGQPTSMLPQRHDAGRLGDRLASFSVCLPAAPRGGVLVVATSGVAAALRLRYPDSIALTAGSPLPEPRTVGLIVLDTRCPQPGSRTELLDTLHEQGVLVLIGDEGETVVYPDTEHPENVWRRGWPLPEVSGLRAQVRRDLGIRRASRHGGTRIKFVGAPFDSLADRIAVDLGAQLGATFHTVGVVTAGHTIIRFRSTDGVDVAVRLSCTAPGVELARSDKIVADVPELAALAPSTIAAGSTVGVPWVASAWVPVRGVQLFDAWRAAHHCSGVVDQLVAVLGSAPLGQTVSGWAGAWVDGVQLVPADRRPALLALLSNLEDGFPTAWCHGDPWSGNVLVQGSSGIVVDWDNACSNAPLGIDALLVRAFSLSSTEDISVGAACVRLVDDRKVNGLVGGRLWTDLDRPVRVALAAAAHLLYLRNRSLHDIGEERLQDEVAALDKLCAALEDAETGSPLDASETASAAPQEPTVQRGAVSGAGWLGLGAGIVKTAQTVVLLILAALLAPSAIGVLAIGALVLNVTSAVTDLGSSTALVHWRGDVERAARSALSLAVALALLLTGGAWLIAPWLSHTLQAGDTGTFVIRGLMLCLPFTAVAGVSQELLRRSLSFKRRVIPDIIGALVGAVVSVVLAMLGHGVASLVIGQLVQAALVMVLCWAMRPPVRPGWTRRDVSGLVSYGGHLAGANILQLLMLNIDYLIVARHLGPQALGVYSMAFRLAYMPYLLVSVVICGAAFAHLCRLRGTDVGQRVVDTAVALSMVVVPLYLGMILLAPQLELLGSKWAGGVPALRWLAVYGLVLSLVNLVLMTLNAVGRTRDSFLLNLLHLVLLAGLLLWWAGRGVQMVAIAQLVAGLGMCALALPMLRRRVEGVDTPRLLRGLAPIAIGSALMVVVGLSAHQLMPWTRVSVLGLVLVGVPLVLVYAAPLFVSRRGHPRPIEVLMRRES